MTNTESAILVCPSALDRQTENDGEMSRSTMDQAVMLAQPGNRAEMAPIANRLEPEQRISRSVMVAALFVQRGGVYWDLPDCDPWDEARDARLYAGPHAAVAHPPCERWGRYWSGGPSARVRRVKGDDAGCFAAALAAVEKWGGLLEHPEGSHAWRAFDIVAPPRSGGWVRAGLYRQGWTCCVEQGHYGHQARKATWLYAARVDLPELIWGPSESSMRLDDGFHSAEERRRSVRTGTVRRLSKAQRSATPEPFRDLLLSIAATARMAS